jgi:two-component system chemotaxis response regulator CheB
VIRLVKAAAEVDLSARLSSGRQRRLGTPGRHTVELIAIAASTGGPPALEEILASLPATIPPVVIAQHLAPSFARGFADWLCGVTRRQVLTVTSGQPLVGGRIYVAGENQHLLVRPGYVEGVSAKANELAPNADLLFQSLAAALGANALGLVLTGMGSDGAIGLKAMRGAGAWTIAQDRDSSVVYGMPRAAAEAGASCEVLALDGIAPRIAQMLNAQRTVFV